MRYLFLCVVLLSTITLQAQFNGGSGDGFAMAETPKYYPVVYYKYVKVNGKLLKVNGKFILKRCYTGEYYAMNDTKEKESFFDGLVQWLASLDIVELIRGKEYGRNLENT